MENRRRVGRRRIAGALGLTLAVIGAATLSGIAPAAAATLTVTNCANSGAGSLRQTVTDAASGDTIKFALSPECSTIDDPTGTILITKNLTITGPGASVLAVSGENTNGVFYVYSGVNASISGLTIEDAAGVESGGGIANYGTLTVTNITLSGNTASSEGGGVSNGGILTVTDSTLSGNAVSFGNGGGIYNDGTLTVTDSTLTGNGVNKSGPYMEGSDIFGGGIYNDGTATINSSTLSGNNVTNAYYGFGGGIANNDGGTLTVTNSTLSGNTATESGGGIYNGSTATINSSTLSGNGATTASGGSYGGSGGGIFNNSDTVNLRSSIVASSPGGDCAYSIDATGITDKGYNIDDDGSCGFALPSISGYTTLSRTLGPLADNGGPTQTIALLPGNPGIDYVPAADCPATDQRGFARTPPCDIGAYDTDTGPVVSPSGLRITTVSLPNGMPKVAYSAPLAATGGNPPYKWSVSSGHLPRGLHLKKSTGIIHGKPNKNDSGTYTFTVKVVDKKVKVKHHHATRNTATKVLSITIS